jgi:hypothetical protein
LWPLRTSDHKDYYFANYSTQTMAAV